MCDKRRASDTTSDRGDLPSKKFKESVCLHSSATTDIDEKSSFVSGNERLQPVNDFESIFAEAEPTPLQYNGKIPLQPEELLLYSLLNTHTPSSKSNCSFQPQKYYYVSKAVYVVYGVRFDCKGIQNYFYRSTNNLQKGLGKFDGHLRWRYYSSNIEHITSKHQLLLLKLLDSEISDSPNCDDLKAEIESECLACLRECNQSRTLAFRVSKDMANIAIKFPKWKVISNVAEASVFLFYYGDNTEKVNYEVIINADGSYQFFYMGKPRTLSIEPNLLPPIINQRNQLHLLMKTLQNLKLCPGFSTENFLNILPASLSTPIFKTSDGKPGAFVETSPMNVQDQVIRSTNCAILLEDKMSTTCKACSDANHYLRTVKSRQTQQSSTSKHMRFDYMTRNELIEHSRESAKKLHAMQVQMKRLKEHQENMSAVGNNTDREFRQLFQELYSGLQSKIKKHDNKLCYWDDCYSEFDSLELLMTHVKAVHLKDVNFSDVAPIDRQYSCEWLGCGKHFGKKKLLVNHLDEHIGNESDMFFLILLKDQAKSLNVPARQMRWHPLVIKWCLRIYAKSHSTYEDLRDSGFLRLPTGRTLSDYKNFCSSKSGWQTSVLQAMSDNFKNQGLPQVGKFGGLFFDEVKIKEGLVFDPSTWELVGFVDLGSDSSIQKNLATHVLQFYFKSIFTNFQFPCAYFLTRGISALNLNQLFWQGVGLLQGFGFTTILSCCDGAAENRAFMMMNGVSEDNSQTNNPFSRLPLFFMSDPPHLIKKLRNNVYNSGYKEMSPRYTRCLLLNSKTILWDHIYSVYQRDKDRHIYATDMRSAHVHLDSISKMRVKLAVDVLNPKVQKDMERHEPVVTESTRLFIANCDKLWKVFNGTNPLYSTTDPRIDELDHVMDFFDKWRNELFTMFQTKSEIASHFITWQTMFDIKVY